MQGERGHGNEGAQPWRGKARGAEALVAAQLLPKRSICCRYVLLLCLETVPAGRRVAIGFGGRVRWTVLPSTRPDGAAPCRPDSRRVHSGFRGRIREMMMPVRVLCALSLSEERHREDTVERRRIRSRNRSGQTQVQIRSVTHRARVQLGRSAARRELTPVHSTVLGHYPQRQRQLLRPRPASSRRSHPIHFQAWNGRWEGFAFLTRFSVMAEQRWCVSVPSRKAKGIKDDLRSRGWLDRTLKVLIRYALRRCVRGKGRGCQIGPWSN